MTTRRAFIRTISGALLAAPFSAEAQRTAKIPRVGYLAASLTASSHLEQAFRQELQALGYAEGRNVVIEDRSADGRLERLPALAAQLVALKVDVIVTGGGTLAALTAKQATQSIPIVAIAVADPVMSGIVSSLARPGGNVTGLSVDSSDLIANRLDLLKQAVPEVGRVAFLWQPDGLGERAERLIRKEAELAAQTRGMQLQIVQARGAADLDRAFAEMASARAEALAAWAGPTFLDEKTRLADLAAKSRLPSVFSFREFVDAGGLMSYGPSLADLFRRAAGYVDRILKGAKPGDLAVESPAKIELVINLKTAKTLELTIPLSLRGRANAVIQ